MSTPTVTTLQRQLLAVIRGSEFTTWARVNGIPLNEQVSLRSMIGKDRRVLELRRAIHALDADAALYFGWHGGAEAEREFRAVVSRCRTAGSAA